MRGFLKAAAAPVVLLALWELLFRTVFQPGDMFSRPSDMLHALSNAFADRTLFKATGETFHTAVLGCLFGAAGGIAVGVPVGLSRPLERVIGPSLEMLRPVPSVALIPLGILVFGFGAEMEVLIVAFACLWPMVTIVANAVRGIEPRLFEVARNLELPWYVCFLGIITPVMVPRLFLGIKLTMGVALVVAVTVEIAANPQGLGYGIVTAQQGLRPDLALGLVFWIGALGMFVNALLQWVERRFFGRYLASPGGAR